MRISFNSSLITKFTLNILFFRLHLVENVGRISLAEVTLIEDPSDEERIDEGQKNKTKSLIDRVIPQK